jgi:Spy/CpxP family protein refolding chaperone
MKMHKSIQLFPVLLFALFITATAHAQSDPAPTQNKDRMSGTQAKPPKQKGEKMEDELKLTPEQKAKFKAADDDFAKKSKSVREDNRDEMKRLRDERQRAHKAALTAEHSAKYDEIQARKAAKKGEKHKHPQKGDKGKMKKDRSGESPRGRNEK